VGSIQEEPVLIKAIKEGKPTIFPIGLALVLSGLGFIFMRTNLGAFEDIELNIYIRTAFIAAAFLLMYNIIEADAFALSNDPRIENPHFWMGAFHTGYLWAVLLIISSWEDMDAAAGLILKFSVFGIFIGLAMTSTDLTITSLDLSKRSVSNNFDINNGMTRSQLPKMLYYSWPFIVILMIAALLSNPPTKGWDASYILFQIIFLGSLLPLYPPKTGGLRFWGSRVAWPRLLGYAILTANLFFFG
jgi:hypothetical protein